MIRKMGWVVLGVVALGALGLVVVACTGPAIGNVFTNVVQNLDSGSGAAPAGESNGNGSQPPNQPPVLGREAEEESNEGLVGGQAETTALALAPTASPAPTSMPAVTATPEPAAMGATGTPAPTATQGPPPTESPEDMFFADYGVNPFHETAEDHLSTFAMDVDTASYTLARSYLRDYQQLPPPEAVRPEEFINYFEVGYEGPEGDDAFAIHLDAAPAPFGEEGHYLLRVGIQGRYIAPEDRDPALLVFVIDVSGSMDRGDRLGLVKEALGILVGQLQEDDRVGIVVYSDNSRVVLEPTPASDIDLILDAINALHPEGSTNVVDGLRLGYRMAQAHKREEQIARVIVLSDGVANVGVTDPEGMLNMVRESVESGITLSTIGFGMGNYNDVLMEQLANDGNGNYFYVDNLREASRIFVYNLVGTLQEIAYDARIQVDFNPDVVARYRLIGYENRAIADTQFRDDTVDAAEIGAGHHVTALYEVELHDQDAEGTIATAYVRYEDGETRQVVEINETIDTGKLWASLDEATADFRLLACVAEFSELLRDSYWAQSGSYPDLLALAAPLVDELPANVQVEEFVELVRLAGRYVDRGG